jgi:hypothetical protein
MKKQKAKGKSEDVVVSPFAELAARIPFRMVMHTSGTRVHSGLFHNDVLGIGYEYHHPGEVRAARAGFYVPSTRAKTKKWFYRLSPKDAPVYPKLAILFENNAELRERAMVAYPPVEKKEGES